MKKSIEKYDRQSVRRRPSLRGIKKCPSCGCINGQRALICCNTECTLRQQQLADLKPFDPIQLIVNESNAVNTKCKWFSVRCKEKLTTLRSFVYMPQQQYQKSNDFDVPAKAICYVNSCKYDIYDTIQISCKHIRACQSCNDETTFQQAVPFQVDKLILWNLNITKDQKQLLWNLYQSDDKYMPAVQCLNDSIFVVKCLKTDTYPAGRLHLAIYPDRIVRKKGTFWCSCKTLQNTDGKDSNNNISQIKSSPHELHCNHVLLVMAAILSQWETKCRYSTFLNNLRTIWMPRPMNDSSPSNEQNSIPNFDVFDEEVNLLDKPPMTTFSSIQNHFSDDLFNFSDELFSDCMLPDFSDIDLDMQNVIDCPKNLSTIELNVSHTNSVYDNVIPKSNDNKLLSPLHQQINKSQNIDLKTRMSDDYVKCNNFYNVDDCCVQDTTTMMPKFDNQFVKSKLWDVCYTNNNSQSSKQQQQQQQQQSLLKPLQVKSVSLVQHHHHHQQQQQHHQQQQQQQLQQVLYIRKSTVSEAVTNSIKCQLPVSQNVIGQEQQQKQQQQSSKILQNKTQIKDCLIAAPILTFDDWLHHIIEVLNEAVDIKDTPHVKQTFHVHEDIFSYFSKTFAVNNKRRLPNTTTVLKSGKYKDFIKYSWHFTQSTTVQRIFTMRQIKFEMERLFYLNTDGSFRRYTPNILLNKTMKDNCVYPKLYTAYVNFNCPNIKKSIFDHINQNNGGLPRMGVQINWLPMSFPQSNYGIMSIEFYIGVEETI